MPDIKIEKIPGLFKNPVVRLFSILIFLLLFSVLLFSVYRLNIHADPAEIFVLDRNSFRQDAPAYFIVFLRNGKTLKPIGNEEFDVDIEDGKKTVRRLKGKTGSDGAALVKIDKELLNSNYSAVVRYKEFEASVKLLIHQRTICEISQDKPVYQPGQTVHVRTLNLHRDTLKPIADKKLNMKIFDPLGNTVFDLNCKSSGFGIASAEFKLADQLNTGSYKIKVTGGGNDEEKSFYVERYEKPRFTLTPTTEIHYLFPGGILKSGIRAEYIFGEPVKNAELSVKLFNEYIEKVEKQSGRKIFGPPVYDYEKREALVSEISGITGEDGVYKFEMTIPEKFKDVANSSGGVNCRLEISVTDASGQKIDYRKKLLATTEPVSISLIPEEQYALPGIENKFFITASYPDGAPAELKLRIRGEDYGTDKNGLGEIIFKPKENPNALRIKINDEGNNLSSVKTIDVPFESGADSFIVKTDKLIYSENEPITLEVLANFGTGRLFCEIEKDWTSLIMVPLDIKNNEGRIKITPPEGLSGTIMLNIYKILPEGKIKQVMRLVQITKKEGLNITASFDKKVYKPGETAKAGFSVTGNDGRPVCAALSIAAVDKGIDALKYRENPLFSKMNFLVKEKLFDPEFRKDVLKVIEEEGKTTGHLFNEYIFSNTVRAFPLSCVHSKSYFEREEKIISAKIDYGNNACSIVLLVLLIIYFAILAIMFAETVSKKTREQLMVPREIKFSASARMNIFITTFICGTMLPGIMGLFLLSDLLNSEAVIILRVISGVIVFFSMISLLKVRYSLYRFLKASDNIHNITDIAVLLFFMSVVVLIILNCTGYFFPNAPYLFLLGFTGFFLSFAPTSFLLTLRFNIVADDWSVNGLGAGLGRRKRKMWLWFVVALCYGGPLIMVYFGAMITVLALFLPLVRIVEKIGGDGGNWAGFSYHKKDEYFSIKQKGLYFESSGETFAGPEAVGVRRFFPETLLWKPEVVTDEKGKASLEFNVADAITDYSLRAGAISKDGCLGDAGYNLKVFQNFFVDFHPPRRVTVNDEISIPVAIYNYLDKEQNISIEISGGSALKVLAGKTVLKVGKYSESRVYVPVKFLKTGPCPIRVTVNSGSGSRDAVEREVNVLPDGRLVEEAVNGFILKSESGSYGFPPRALPENRSCFFKLYPAPGMEISEAIASMMSMPYGCFEQTSSVTYPNILIYRYLKAHNRLSSTNAEKAEEYISVGCQKMLSYQNSDGGFALYNGRESSPRLTAYGIFVLSEINREFHTGGKAVARAVGYLNEAMFNKKESSWLDLRETAYIVMALCESGNDVCISREIKDFIKTNAGKCDNPYTLALCANALSSHDRQGAREILEKLDGMKKEKDGLCCWRCPSGDIGIFGTTGRGIDIATTALVVNAMNRTGFAPDLIYRSVRWLMSERSPNGLWGSTQSSVQAMRAIMGVRSKELVPLKEGEKAAIKLSFNSFVKELEVKNNGGVLPYSVDLGTALSPCDNKFAINSSCSAPLAYRFVMTYYMPWDVKIAESGLALSVVYSKTELVPGEELECLVNVKNQKESDVRMGMVTMDIPPGFEAEEHSLIRLYDEKIVSSYSMDSEKIILYFDRFRVGMELKFPFRLKAKYPVKIKTPPVCAYAYYQPELSAVSAPQQLTVKEEKTRSAGK